MTFSIPSITLPPGWSLTHLISLGDEWQANLKDDEHVAIGTGASPEDAILSAARNAERGEFAGRLFYLQHKAPNNARPESAQLSLIGLGFTSSPVPRRQIG